MKKKRNMKKLGWKKSGVPLDLLCVGPTASAVKLTQMRLEHNAPLCPSTAPLVTHADNCAIQRDP